MKILSILEEGEALKKRFSDLKRDKKISRPAFAKEHSLSGGDALIYQHITGRRPISMEAALIYAKGFGVSLEEISPRLAIEARRSAEGLGEDATLRKSNDPLLHMVAMHGVAINAILLALSKQDGFDAKKFSSDIHQALLAHEVNSETKKEGVHSASPHDYILLRAQLRKVLPGLPVH